MNRIVRIATVFSIGTVSTALAFAANTVVEPLYTKSAQKYGGLLFYAYAEHYKGRKYEEIEEVDATEL